MSFHFYINSWALFAVISAGLIGRAAPPVDYLTQVKPILAEHCYKCHGGSQQKSGLRVDTAALLARGGESGRGFIPANAANSLVIQALRGTHATLPRMPYKKPPLSNSEISQIAEWIEQGSHAPASEQPEASTHWSFIRPTSPELPKLKDESRASSPIDCFIQAQLEAKGIPPAPEADRRTLLRRLSLDLIGLPPAPEEIEAFVNDRRSDAYEREVERLLASPHYGERWGRWWLDAARYADSNGYSIDAPRQIWKYRDWVIAAFNKDQPFDQFVIEQLAGDLLPGLDPKGDQKSDAKPTLEQKIATGFNRNTQINQEGGIDPEQFRVESVIDRVNTFGTVFLGLTIGCAQCHDHKFDPISQREYYQLFAFFNSTEEDGHGKAAPAGMMEIPGAFEPLNEKDIEEAGAELERYLNTKGSAVLEWEKDHPNRSIPDSWSERSVEQKRSSYRAFKPDDAEFKSRDSKLAKLEKREPKPVTTLVMRELEKPRESFVFTKGDFTRPAQKVTPGVPAVLHQLQAPADRLPNRLDLARWTVDPENPLLARVIVNRVWQQYFGRGLVETENDFGTQGGAPSHPELLDWLALAFMSPTLPTAPGPGPSNPSSPWSFKHLHRAIVQSATYRQSSRARPELAMVDPANRLLAHQSRLRLDAELVRDAALRVSGLLAPEIGGPPVFPPQPDGVMSLGQVKREWKTSTGAERYRRALYTQFWRATPHPALSVFDAADGFGTCTRRLRSNTPLQALTLLNDRQFYEFAEALAQRLQQQSGSTRERIDYAFHICLGRSALETEQTRLGELLASDSEKPWLTLARVMLNLDETITRE